MRSKSLGTLLDGKSFRRLRRKEKNLQRDRLFMKASSARGLARICLPVNVVIIIIVTIAIIIITNIIIIIIIISNISIDIIIIIIINILIIIIISIMASITTSINFTITITTIIIIVVRFVTIIRRPCRRCQRRSGTPSRPVVVVLVILTKT